MAETTHFELRRTHFSRGVCVIVAFLLVANCCALFVQYALDHPEVWGLVPLFHFDREQNLPTFFSALMLLVSAALLYAAALKANNTGKDTRPWMLLALVFAFLSVDEVTSIHEKIDALIKFYTPASGILHHAWVAPYGVAVTLLAIVLGPWFFKLERRLQVLFFTSGALFVGGAIGVEIVNCLYYSGLADHTPGTTTLTGDILASVEELGEMAGVALFIYTLLTHLAGEHGKIRLQFG